MKNYQLNKKIVNPKRNTEMEKRGSIYKKSPPRRAPNTLLLLVGYSGYTEVEKLFSCAEDGEDDVSRRFGRRERGRWGESGVTLDAP